MELLLTLDPARKRQMLFVPEINDQSFLFFFEKGNHGLAFSLRDYSEPSRVRERFARDFGCTAEAIRQKAMLALDAPLMDVNNLAEWHAYTVALNQAHEIGRGTPSTAKIARPPFPFLNAEAFQRNAKSAKAMDVRNMRESGQSEDWVTWNLMNLLTAAQPEHWLRELFATAKSRNPELPALGLDPNAEVHFWRCVDSPRAYEQASRERMRRSADPVAVARTSDARPVEGRSEIDMTLESQEWQIFIEAKLGADIEMRTTWDPARNQIARNIDCLLECAGSRMPLFWMIVRDDSPARAYSQLMTDYQRNPALLIRDLPHRDPEVLRRVAKSLTVLTWRQIGSQSCSVEASDNALLAEIKGELRRRIQ